MRYNATTRVIAIGKPTITARETTTKTTGTTPENTPGNTPGNTSKCIEKPP